MLPSLSSEELIAQADLAGRARVVAVKTAADGTRTAKLQFATLVKGKIPSRVPLLRRLVGAKIISVKMRSRLRGPQGETLPGEWSDPYRAGDFVMTHLRWDAEEKAYTTISWNAVWLVPHSR